MRMLKGVGEIKSNPGIHWWQDSMAQVGIYSLGNMHQYGLSRLVNVVLTKEKGALVFAMTHDSNNDWTYNFLESPLTLRLQVNSEICPRPHERFQVGWSLWSGLIRNSDRLVNPVFGPTVNRCTHQWTLTIVSRIVQFWKAILPQNMLCWLYSRGGITHWVMFRGGCFWHDVLFI